MNINRRIIAAESAVDTAIRRRDTRKLHHALNELKVLRTERLKREARWRAVMSLFGTLGRTA